MMNKPNQNWLIRAFQEHTPIALLYRFLLVLLLNTSIAVLLFLIGNPFIGNMIISHSIGLTIFSMVEISQAVVPINSRLRRLVQYTVIVPVGVITGALLARYIIDYEVYAGKASGETVFLSTIYLGLFFSFIVSQFMYSRSVIADTQKKLHLEETRRLQQEKLVVSAQLKTIQAQIEPHFLFNTLATLDSLIDSNPKQAQSMLDNLNRYLRTSLLRTRTGDTSLAEEIEMLAAYLSIQQIRMGQRLRYSFDIAPDTENFRLPPLLLQPIVENAIRHGLELKPEGGAVSISSRYIDDMLCLTVQDTGVGLNHDWHPGTGLQNIRERIRILYDDLASLDIRGNTEGVSVQLRLPKTNTL